MRAKIWRASDPHRVAVWHGELDETGPGQYQVPDSASGFLGANEEYQWIVYEGELPESARTLPPDTTDDDEPVHVRTFVLRTWQLHTLVFLGVFFCAIGIVDVLTAIVRWVF